MYAHYDWLRDSDDIQMASSFLQALTFIDVDIIDDSY